MTVIVIIMTVADKHMVRAMVDKKLLKDLADAGEIRITKDYRVYGLEQYLRRTMLRRGKR
jgi:hypothetical protein